MEDSIILWIMGSGITIGLFLISLAMNFGRQAISRIEDELKEIRNNFEKVAGKVNDNSINIARLESINGRLEKIERLVEKK